MWLSGGGDKGSFSGSWRDNQVFSGLWECTCELFIFCTLFYEYCYRWFFNLVVFSKLFLTEPVIFMLCISSSCLHPAAGVWGGGREGSECRVVCRVLVGLLSWGTPFLKLRRYDTLCCYICGQKQLPRINPFSILSPFCFCKNPAFQIVKSL